MALNFKKISKAAGLVDSDLKVGHKAGQISDHFDEVMTINRVDFTHGVNPQTGERTRYAIFICDEYPKEFFGAGAMFDANIDAWRVAAEDTDAENAEYTDNCDNLNAELRRVGGIKLRFSRQISRKGQSYNYVEFVE